MPPHAFEHDNELTSLLQNIRQSPNHPIRVEVDQLIAGLHLKPFLSEAHFGPNEPTKRVLKEEPNATPNDPITPNTAKTAPKKVPVNISTTRDAPLLTDTERKMSLDLMLRPSPDTIHQRASSWSKPAPTSTSAVNVISKADIVKSALGAEKKDQRNIPIKSMLKDARRRFSFMAKKEEKSPLLGTLDDRLRRAVSPPSETISPVEKLSRRVSLVIENLPNYIKEQLDAKSPDESPSPKLTKTSPRVSSRVQNLLANSQSFYARAESPKSHRDSATDENEDHLSDYDKEYILPALVSRLYENGDPVLNGIEELSEDAEFININDSYDEEEDEGEGEDDYLFRA